MSRKVIPLRGTEEEHAFWKQAAKDAGLSFSVWARNCLNVCAADETASPAIFPTAGKRETGNPYVATGWSPPVQHLDDLVPRRPAGKRSYKPDPR